MTQTKIGHKIIHLERIDSTNNYAAKLCAEGEIAHGTVILADMQTDGRGQRGNTWQSDPFSNLTMSLFLNAHPIIKNQSHFLNYIISLSLKDTLTRHVKKAKIKWPNDILIENKKLAGILIESQWGSQRLNSSIVGIGINLNQQSFENTLSTSLRNACGNFFQPYKIMLEFCFHLQERWSQLSVDSLRDMKDEYDRGLWLRAEESYYVHNSSGKEFKAILVGTDNKGDLLLQKENGQIESFSNQSIRFKDRIM